MKLGNAITLGMWIIYNGFLTINILNTNEQKATDSERLWIMK